MTTETTADISILSADEVEAHIDALGALLEACVRDGASVNFILPYTVADAKAFWTKKVLARMRDGAALTVMVVWQDGWIAGSVQLDCDTPPNQAHRADIKKLLVHPDFQRRGLGRRLMMEIEAVARDQGRTLLTLDTRSGDKGEPLYQKLGYITAGIIPNYSRDAREERLDAATFMYKPLRAARDRA